MQEHIHKQSLAPQKGKPTLLLICIALLGIAGIAITVFRVPFSTVLFYGAILACPLMHIFMMRGMTHGESHKH